MMKLVTQTRFLSKKYGDMKAVEIIKNAGFDAYDYTMSDSEGLLSDNYTDKIKALKAHADKIGITCAQAHAPYADNMADIITAVIRAMEYAAYLGANIIVVHPIADNYNYYERKEELFNENMDFYRQLIPHAERFGIKVAIENTYGWDRERQLNIESACSHNEELARYIDTLNSEYIVACVDTGHSQLVNEAPETMLLNLGSRVGALHVHDNTGLDDAHNIPYSGTINWDNVCTALAKIGYKGNFTFEADRFFNQYMDDEFILYAVKYLEQVGRSLIKKIER